MGLRAFSLPSTVTKASLGCWRIFRVISGLYFVPLGFVLMKDDRGLSVSTCVPCMRLWRGKGGPGRYAGYVDGSGIWPPGMYPDDRDMVGT